MTCQVWRCRRQAVERSQDSGLHVCRAHADRKAAPETILDEQRRVIDAAEALIDVTLVGHTDRQTDETFVECRACGGWEEHTDECFVPALEKWLSS